jgi:hypothetical protein
MINMTRGEEMTLEVKLDVEPEETESLTLIVVQGGRPVVRKEKADAEPDPDEGCVYFGLTGAETALLRAGIPAFVQARCTLPGGAVMKSAAEELCVMDTPGMKEV